MTAYAPIPSDRLPGWLRQLDGVVEVYADDPRTGYGAALCRWCSMTWPLPIKGFEEDPFARAAWIMGVAEHGLEHAANGDIPVGALEGDGAGAGAGGACG